MQAASQSVTNPLYYLPAPTALNPEKVTLTGWQSFLLNLPAFTSVVSMGLLAAIVAFTARLAFAVHTPDDGGGNTYNWMRVGQVSEG